ncbi:hypothetical protein M501DRAFT_1033532 [Patellaria atrata CBS 101060]|uniref:C2H2-type domain-containing protein n=1 Tax=Patellaria atrata CBS 101060 TaxID=1346257 RepID=A0A9P4S6Z6_9PEZI|nr:hypothetical protein M501DRAFT_1033532 [Patellaria atrata CBS 101060]
MNSLNAASSANPENKYVCLWKGCNDFLFTRATDLDRHYKAVHLKRREFFCPVLGCPRHVLAEVRHPFPRKDKRSDHVRKAHRNQFVNLGVVQQEFETSASPTDSSGSEQSPRSTSEESVQWLFWES